MSEPFDPEKVERTRCCDLCGDFYVKGADYDHLLEVHLRQKESLAKAVATIEAIERECLIGCRSLPSVRNAIDCEISPAPFPRAKS